MVLISSNEEPAWGRWRYDLIKTINKSDSNEWWYFYVGQIEVTCNILATISFPWFSKGSKLIDSEWIYNILG